MFLERKKVIFRVLIELIIAFSLSFLISLLSSDSISPVFGSFHGDSFSVDGVLFMYDAKAILAGKRPYLDVFDHKGLYHLGVNILGLLISETFGLLILETIFGGIALFVLFKALEKMDLSRLEIAVAIGFFATLRLLIGGGNTIGIWLLPFATAYLYFYIRAIKEDKENYLYVGSIFIGIEMALALNSRPLDAIYAYGGVIWLFVYALKEHKMKLFWMNVLVAFLIFLLICDIFAIIAVSGGYFKEMAVATILENFIYIGRTKDFPLDQVFFRIGAGIHVILSFVFERLEKKWGAASSFKNFLFIGSLSIFIPCIFLGRYLSYLLCGLSFLSIWLIFFLRSFPKEKMGFIIKTTLGSVFLLGAILLGSLTPTLYYTTGIGDFSYSLNKMDEDALKEIIPEEDRDGGKVFALDCSCAVYLSLDVISEERFYANQSWWALDNDTVISEVITFIETKEPKWLIVAKEEETKKTFKEALSLYDLVSEKAARFDIYRLKGI